MSSDLQLLIWEPSIYRGTLECRGCAKDIPAKSPFFILESEIKYLLPHDSPYQAYSVRCAACGLLDFLHTHFGQIFQDTIKNYNVGYGESYATPFMTSIRELVRAELKHILKEEAFDPNGPFSPAP